MSEEEPLLLPITQERVEGMLLVLAYREGCLSINKAVALLQEMGFMVGPETVSNAFKRLVDDKLMYYDGSHYCIAW